MSVWYNDLFILASETIPADICGVFIHELELENDRGAVETSFSFFIARFYNQML